MQLGLGLSIANLNVAPAPIAAPYPDPSINWDSSSLLYVNSLQVSASVQLSTVEQTATNNLFKRMKGLDPAYSNFGNTGIYNACKALYPYVGSNLEAYKFNAVFPTAVTQATDDAGYPTSPGYQYIAGGITVDGIYGPKGNGTNGVILTQLNWAQAGGLAASLTWNSLCMGAVYKTTSAVGRDDFGWYSPTAGEGGIWLRTKPTAQSRQGCLEGSSISGTNLVIGGRGHWMLWRSAADKRVYYQQVQQTYPAGADRTGEGNATFGGQTTWPFLGLNFANFNGTGGGASAATRAANCVNFSSNTLMLNYVMDPFADTLISAWNQIVEDFCVETGKKTW